MSARLRGTDICELPSIVDARASAAAVAAKTVRVRPLVRPPELTDEHYATGDLAACSDGVLCMNVHGIANESLRQHIRLEAQTAMPAGKRTKPGDEESSEEESDEESGDNESMEIDDEDQPMGTIIHPEDVLPLPFRPLISGTRPFEELNIDQQIALAIYWYLTYHKKDLAPGGIENVNWKLSQHKWLEEHDVEKYVDGDFKWILKRGWIPSTWRRDEHREAQQSIPPVVTGSIQYLLGLFISEYDKVVDEVVANGTSEGLIGSKEFLYVQTDPKTWWGPGFWDKLYHFLPSWPMLALEYERIEGPEGQEPFRLPRDSDDNFISQIDALVERAKEDIENEPLDPMSDNSKKCRGYLQSMILGYYKDGAVKLDDYLEFADKSMHLGWYDDEDGVRPIFRAFYAFKPEEWVQHIIVDGKFEFQVYELVKQLFGTSILPTSNDDYVVRGTIYKVQANALQSAALFRYAVEALTFSWRTLLEEWLAMDAGDENKPTWFVDDDMYYIFDPNTVLAAQATQAAPRALIDSIHCVTVGDECRRFLWTKLGPGRDLLTDPVRLNYDVCGRLYDYERTSSLPYLVPLPGVLDFFNFGMALISSSYRATPGRGNTFESIVQNVKSRGGGVENALKNIGVVGNHSPRHRNAVGLDTISNWDSVHGFHDNQCLDNMYKALWDEPYNNPSMRDGPAGTAHPLKLPEALYTKDGTPPQGTPPQGLSKNEAFELNSILGAYAQSKLQELSSFKTGTGKREYKYPVKHPSERPSELFRAIRAHRPEKNMTVASIKPSKRYNPWTGFLAGDSTAGVDKMVDLACEAECAFKQIQHVMNMVKRAKERQQFYDVQCVEQNIPNSIGLGVFKAYLRGILSNTNPEDRDRLWNKLAEFKDMGERIKAYDQEILSKLGLWIAILTPDMKKLIDDISNYIAAATSNQSPSEADVKYITTSIDTLLRKHVDVKCQEIKDAATIAKKDVKMWESRQRGSFGEGIPYIQTSKNLDLGLAPWARTGRILFSDAWHCEGGADGTEYTKHPMLTIMATVTKTRPPKWEEAEAHSVAYSEANNSDTKLTQAERNKLGHPIKRDPTDANSSSYPSFEVLADKEPESYLEGGPVKIEFKERDEVLNTLEDRNDFLKTLLTIGSVSFEQAILLFESVEWAIEAHQSLVYQPIQLFKATASDVNVNIYTDRVPPGTKTKSRAKMRGEVAWGQNASLYTRGIVHSRRITYSDLSQRSKVIMTANEAEAVTKAGTSDYRMMDDSGNVGGFTAVKPINYPNIPVEKKKRFEESMKEQMEKMLVGVAVEREEQYLMAIQTMGNIMRYGGYRKKNVTLSNFLTAWRFPDFSGEDPANPDHPIISTDGFHDDDELNAFFPGFCDLSNPDRRSEGDVLYGNTIKPPKWNPRSIRGQAYALQIDSSGSGGYGSEYHDLFGDRDSLVRHFTSIVDQYINLYLPVDEKLVNDGKDRISKILNKKRELPEKKALIRDSKNILTPEQKKMSILDETKSTPAEKKALAAQKAKMTAEEKKQLKEEEKAVTKAINDNVDRVLREKVFENDEDWTGYLEWAIAKIDQKKSQLVRAPDMEQSRFDTPFKPLSKDIREFKTASRIFTRNGPDIEALSREVKEIIIDGGYVFATDGDGLIAELIASRVLSKEDKSKPRKRWDGIDQPHLEAAKDFIGGEVAMYEKLKNLSGDLGAAEIRKLWESNELTATEAVFSGIRTKDVIKEDLGIDENHDYNKLYNVHAHTRRLSELDHQLSEFGAERRKDGANFVSNVFKNAMEKFKDDGELVDGTDITELFQAAFDEGVKQYMHSLGVKCQTIADNRTKAYMFQAKATFANTLWTSLVDLARRDVQATDVQRAMKAIVIKMIEKGDSKLENQEVLDLINQRKMTIAPADPEKQKRLNELIKKCYYIRCLCGWPGDEHKVHDLRSLGRTWYIEIQEANRIAEDNSGKPRGRWESYISKQTARTGLNQREPSAVEAATAAAGRENKKRRKDSQFWQASQKEEPISVAERQAVVDLARTVKLFITGYITPIKSTDAMREFELLTLQEKAEVGRAEDEREQRLRKKWPGIGDISNGDVRQSALLASIQNFAIEFFRLISEINQKFETLKDFSPVVQSNLRNKVATKDVPRFPIVFYKKDENKGKPMLGNRKREVNPQEAALKGIAVVQLNPSPDPDDVSPLHWWTIDFRNMYLNPQTRQYFEQIRELAVDSEAALERESKLQAERATDIDLVERLQLRSTIPDKEAAQKRLGRLRNIVEELNSQPERVEKRTCDFLIQMIHRFALKGYGPTAILSTIDEFVLTNAIPQNNRNWIRVLLNDFKIDVTSVQQWEINWQAALPYIAVLRAEDLFTRLCLFRSDPSLTAAVDNKLETLEKRLLLDSVEKGGEIAIYGQEDEEVEQVFGVDIRFATNTREWALLEDRYRKRAAISGGDSVAPQSEDEIRDAQKDASLRETRPMLSNDPDFPELRDTPSALSVYQALVALRALGRTPSATRPTVRAVDVVQHNFYAHFFNTACGMGGASSNEVKQQAYDERNFKNAIDGFTDSGARFTDEQRRRAEAHAAKWDPENKYRPTFNDYFKDVVRSTTELRATNDNDGNAKTSAEQKLENAELLLEEMSRKLDLDQGAVPAADKETEQAIQAINDMAFNYSSFRNAASRFNRNEALVVLSEHIQRAEYNYLAGVDMFPADRRIWLDDLRKRIEAAIVQKGSDPQTVGLHLTSYFGLKVDDEQKHLKTHAKHLKVPLYPRINARGEGYASSERTYARTLELKRRKWLSETVSTVANLDPRSMFEEAFVQRLALSSSTRSSLRLTAQPLVDGEDEDDDPPEEDFGSRDDDDVDEAELFGDDSDDGDDGDDGGGGGGGGGSSINPEQPDIEPPDKNSEEWKNWRSREDARADKRGRAGAAAQSRKGNAPDRVGKRRLDALMSVDNRKQKASEEEGQQAAAAGAAAAAEAAAEADSMERLKLSMSSAEPDCAPLGDAFFAGISVTNGDCLYHSVLVSLALTPEGPTNALIQVGNQACSRLRSFLVAFMRDNGFAMKPPTGPEPAVNPVEDSEWRRWHAQQARSKIFNDDEDFGGQFAFEGGVYFEALQRYLLLKRTNPEYRSWPEIDAETSPKATLVRAYCLQAEIAFSFANVPEIEMLANYLGRAVCVYQNDDGKPGSWMAKRGILYGKAFRGLGVGAEPLLLLYGGEGEGGARSDHFQPIIPKSRRDEVEGNGGLLDFLESVDPLKPFKRPTARNAPYNQQVVYAQRRVAQLGR